MKHADSYLLRHEQCPSCAEKGKDRSGDNLGVYSDGHKYCYSCGYTHWPKQTAALLRKREKMEDVAVSIPEGSRVVLPNDVTFNIPKRAVEWTMQYGITTTDMLSRGIMWSEDIQRLIFPVYDGEDNIIAWVGRDFLDSSGKKRAKWFTQGNFRDMMNILGIGDTIVLVEDIVSAIKVAKCGVMAIPLYGCVVKRPMLERIKALFGTEKEVVIWLDPDKSQDALTYSNLSKMCGLSTRAIISGKDPKEHSYQDIRNFLGVKNEKVC